MNSGEVPSSNEAIPLHKRETWGYLKQIPYPLFLGTLLMEIAYGIFFFPLAQVYLPDHLGLGIGIAGYLMSTYGLFRMLSQLPAGWLADKLSFRATTAISISFILVATTILLLAESRPVALSAAAFYGLGIAIIWPTIYAALAETFKAPSRGKVMGMMNIAMIGGAGLGAMGGALLVGLVGYAFAFRLNFVLNVLALILFNLWKKGRTATEIKPSLSYPRLEVPALKVLLAPRVLTFALLILAISLSSNTVVPVVRTYGLRVLNLEFHQLALLALPLGVVGALMLVGAGHLADRFGRPPLLLAGLIILMSSLVGLGQTTNPRLVVGLALLGIVGASLIIPSWGAAAMDLSQQGSRGRLLGLVMAMQGLGETIGPAIGGRLNELYGPLASVNFSAATLASAVLICLGYVVSWRRQPKSLPGGKPRA